MSKFESVIPRKLLRSSIWVLLVKVFNRGLALAIAVLLSRQFGANEYGVFSLAIALVSFLLIFNTLGLPTLLTKEVAANLTLLNWQRFRGVITMSFRLVALTSFILLIMAFATVSILSDQLDEPTKFIIFIAAASLPFTAVTHLFFGILRGMHFVVAAELVNYAIRPFLTLTGLVCLVFVFGQIDNAQTAITVQLGAAAFAALIALITTAVLVPKQIKTVSPVFSSVEWIKRAYALTLVGASTAVNRQLDIFMLAIFASTYDVGIYNVAAQGGALVAFGAQIAAGAMASQFAKYFALKDQSGVQKLAKFSTQLIFGISVIISLPLFLFGGELAASVFGAEFRECYTALVILSVGQVIGAAMGSPSLLLNMSGHEHEVGRAYLLTAGANVALNLLLIPIYGLEGAAAATALSLVARQVHLTTVAIHRTNINTLIRFRSPLDPKREN